MPMSHLRFLSTVCSGWPWPQQPGQSWTFFATLACCCGVVVQPCLHAGSCPWALWRCVLPHQPSQWSSSDSPTWADTFVLAALCLVFPGLHIVLLDSDCVPVTLFEVEDLQEAQRLQITQRARGWSLSLNTMLGSMQDLWFYGVPTMLLRSLKLIGKASRSALVTCKTWPLANIGRGWCRSTGSLCPQWSRMTGMTGTWHLHIARLGCRLGWRWLHFVVILWTPPWNGRWPCHWWENGLHAPYFCPAKESGLPGLVSCWWFLVSVHMVYLKPHNLARRTELIQGRKAVNWLKPHWLKLPLGFEHSLASFVRWTGRCCLYPLRGSYYKVFNEAWHNPINSTAWSSDLEPYGGYRCIAWTLGLHWHSSLRHQRWPRTSRIGIHTGGTRHFAAHTIRWEGIRTWTGFPARLLTLRRTTEYILPWGSLIWIPLLTTCCTRCIWCTPTWFNHTRALVRSFRLQDLSSAFSAERDRCAPRHSVPEVS